LYYSQRNSADSDVLAGDSAALTPPQLDQRNEVDTRGPDGHTPLHIAAISSSEEGTLLCLLEEGASVHAVTDQYGRTAFNLYPLM